jgi:hypothetical protein
MFTEDTFALLGTLESHRVGPSHGTDIRLGLYLVAGCIVLQGVPPPHDQELYRPGA